MEDEQQLFQRAHDGDREALEELLRQHEQRIYRYGLRMCGDEDAAREVLQRTLLTAFEQIGTFRGEARLSTWLFAIARSVCGRLHRRTRSAPLHDMALDADEAPVLVSHDLEPEESAQRAELAELVGAAIAGLPPSYREAVVLRDVEGLAAEEVALTLGLQIPALKSRLHRGRQMLKVSLAALLRDGAGPGGAQPCPQLLARLNALEGRPVDRSACAEIEQHLDACETCRVALGDLREAASLCRRLPGDDVPDAVKRAVRTALREAVSRPPA